MEPWQHAMLARASIMDGTQGAVRWAKVLSVNPEVPSARVRILPDGVESGDLPIMQMMAGDGVGIVALPSPGDQVQLLPCEGSGQHYAVLPGTWTLQAQPPRSPATDGSAIQPGDIGLFAKGGAWIHIGPGGKMFFHAAEHIFDGPVRVKNGGVRADQDVVAGTVSLQHHTHGGVSSGSAHTAPPDA